MDAYALLFASTLSAGTVLALASLGLLINEKVGIVNLGAEGMMLCAALAGFATVVATGSTGLGFAAGMAAGAVLAGIFGVLVIWLNTNQYATGLALSLFGAGFSAFAGLNFVQAKMPTLPKYSIPGLSDIPLIGPALFNHHPLVYLAVVLALGLMWWLDRSRTGLVLRAVGESPDSAHALGYPVRRIRLLAVMAGGALCGLAGAYISTVYTPVGRRHGCRPGLDCPGPDYLCHLATCAGAAGRVFVWWGDHAAVSLASLRGAGGQPAVVDAALCGDHRCFGVDFAQPHLDSCEHARLVG